MGGPIQSMERGRTLVEMLSTLPPLIAKLIVGLGADCVALSSQPPTELADRMVSRV